MKQFRFFVMTIAASLALSFTSCNHDDFDNEIDTETIKTELTDAIKTVYGVETSAVDSVRSTTTVVMDSASSATAPVINVYVDTPLEPGGSTYSSDEDFIAALAIVMVFVVPCLTFLLVIGAILVFIYKRNRSHNAVIEQAIRAGYELPESFYNGRQRANQAKDSELLQSAIKLIGTGALLCVSFIVVLDFTFVGLICLIPAIIGIGRLIAYFIAVKDNDSHDTTVSNND